MSGFCLYEIIIRHVPSNGEIKISSLAKTLRGALSSRRRFISENYPGYVVVSVNKVTEE